MKYDDLSPVPTKIPRRRKTQLHEALRLIRVFHDLKAIELAKRMNVSRNYISEIERGKKRPSMAVIEKYSKAFNLPASTIVYFGEQLRVQDCWDYKIEIDAEEKVVAFARLMNRFEDHNKK